LTGLCFGVIIHTSQQGAYNEAELHHVHLEA
jgi:hypothetical protein